MRFALIALILTAPLVSHANFKARYGNITVQDVANGSFLEKRLEHNDRTLCPKVKDRRRSTCFRDFVKRTTIRSSQHLTALLRAGARAVELDKNHDEALNTVEGIDNQLTTLEGVKIENFFLHVVALEDSFDKEEQAEAKAKDERKLFEFKGKLLEGIENALNKVESSKYKDRHSEMSKRYKALKAVVWTYPPEQFREPASGANNFTIPAPPVPVPNIKTAGSSWCSDFSVTRCFKLDYPSCSTLLNKSLAECGGKTDCAVGKWIRSAQLQGRMHTQKECKDVFVPMSSQGASGE